MNTLIQKYQNVLSNLLPKSVLAEVECFVLYDYHPMDQRQLDITICTKCEIREYHQRELIASLQFQNASDIKIVRNFKCELFYLVSGNNAVGILSSNKGQIAVHKHVPSVVSMTMDDPTCTGHTTLKIMQENDDLLVFNENFNISQPRAESEKSLPLLHQLGSKLTQAMYTTNCNEKTLEEYTKIRQVAAFSLYQKVACDLKDSAVNLRLEKIASALKVKTQIPIVTLCNKKIVVILKICNKNDKPMENVHVLLHGSSLPSINYTTKLFKDGAPCWKELDTQIESNSESVLTATIDLKELKHNVTSRLDFDVVMSYKMNDESYLLPFESVSISAVNTMGKDFDVLACDTDHKKIILAILATSHKVDLKLWHLKNHIEPNINISDVFDKCLTMKRFNNNKNIAIHNESPYHILHGVMVVFPPNTIQDHAMDIKVYTRKPSQVLALIHNMHDRVPHRIVAITPEYKLKLITDEYFANFNEELDVTNNDYIAYALSIKTQITIIRQYLLDCQSEIMNVDDGVDKFNFMTLGVNKYLEFRQKLLNCFQSHSS